MKKYTRPEMRMTEFEKTPVMTLSTVKGIDLVNNNEIPTDSKNFVDIESLFS